MPLLNLGSIQGPSGNETGIIPLSYWSWDTSWGKFYIYILPLVKQLHKPRAFTEVSSKFLHTIVCLFQMTNICLVGKTYFGRIPKMYFGRLIWVGKSPTVPDLRVWKMFDFFFVQWKMFDINIIIQKTSEISIWLWWNSPDTKYYTMYFVRHFLTDVVLHATWKLRCGKFSTRRTFSNMQIKPL